MWPSCPYNGKAEIGINLDTAAIYDHDVMVRCLEESLAQVLASARSRATENPGITRPRGPGRRGLMFVRHPDGERVPGGVSPVGRDLGDDVAVLGVISNWVPKSLRFMVVLPPVCGGLCAGVR